MSERPPREATDLAPTLKTAVADLRAKAAAGADREKAARALYHLWKLVHERG